MFANPPSRFAKARLVPTLMLRPSGFLYNTRNADSYTLNPVGKVLVEALLRGVAPDRLWQELPGQFAVSESLAHCDTLQFLSALHQLGLLTLPKDEAGKAGEADEADEADEAGGAAAAGAQTGVDRP